MGELTGCEDDPWLRFKHLEEYFSSNEVQFRNFCLVVKTSFPSAENIETPADK